MWRDRGQGAHGQLLPQEAQEEEQLPGAREEALSWQHQRGGEWRPPHSYPNGGAHHQQDDAGERRVERVLQREMAVIMDHATGMFCELCVIWITVLYTWLLLIINENRIELTSDLIQIWIFITSFYRVMRRRKAEGGRWWDWPTGRVSVTLSPELFLESFLNSVWLNDDIILDFIQSLFKKHWMFNK